MNYIELETPCGAIRGIDHASYAEFRGIEYAKAGRFEYPVQTSAWAGVYDATSFGDCSYQHRAFEDDSKVNAFYHKEFRQGLSFTYSENCLYLNIFTPKGAKNCPVIIYIHGGSFTGGSANEGHISGANFAENGIITVALNYRLGPFGFCAHPDLTKDGVCGNYGLFDQTAAIKWVKDNISAFGGDAGKIILMGQSAGAMSVDIHLSNPLLKGCISGAIMLSGAGLQRFLLKPLESEKTVKFWAAVIKNAGVSTAGALAGVDAKKFYYAWLKACRETTFSMPYTFPVYDGAILKKGEFSPKTIADMPYIIGQTATDMIPSVLESVHKKWGRYCEKNNKSKCYFYNFTRLLPGDNCGAWHSSDLLYAFSTLDFNWRPFEKVDYEISHSLSQAICAFAKSLNPNCTAVPQWAAGVKKPMHFCENTRAARWDTAANIRSTFTNKGMG
ncbi:MAG: carboxylesterase family protein [Clostridiales bacterium]|nr:carboxylesterase family protein [Clostridiales bacterium]